MPFFGLHDGGKNVYVESMQTRSCAVEHADEVDVCAICADDRQWVPEAGQQWTTLPELAKIVTAQERADGVRMQQIEVQTVADQMIGRTNHGNRRSCPPIRLARPNPHDM